MILACHALGVKFCRTFQRKFIEKHSEVLDYANTFFGKNVHRNLADFRKFEDEI